MGSRAESPARALIIDSMLITGLGGRRTSNESGVRCIGGTAKPTPPHIPAVRVVCLREGPVSPVFGRSGRTCLAIVALPCTLGSAVGAVFVCDDGPLVVIPQ